MLAFLHTAQVHVATFERLLREVDGTIPTHHAIREDLLAEARAAGGMTNTLRSALAEALQALGRAGAKVIVVTCSTLGGAAESAPVPQGVSVLRIDRPMVERAVTSGRPILVVAALATTLKPTMDLLRQISREQQTTVDVREHLCAHAWALFEAGNGAGYVETIAGEIEREAAKGDIVLLAQASMAPAGELLAHLDIPVLSSPRAGVQAAVAKYRAPAP